MIALLIEVMLQGLGGLAHSFFVKSDDNEADQADPVKKTRAPIALWVDAALVTVSLLAGGWWGARVLVSGQTYPPITMWTLLVAGLASAIWALTAEKSSADMGAEQAQRRWFQLDRSRSVRFAVLNLAGAVGIAAGYFS